MSSWYCDFPISGLSRHFESKNENNLEIPQPTQLWTCDTDTGSVFLSLFCSSPHTRIQILIIINYFINCT